MGNGHGGSLTYLIEACEVSVAFMGERTIQAQVPSRGTVTLVKKK